MNVCKSKELNEIATLLGKMSEILDKSIFEMKAKKYFNNKRTC